MPVLTLQGCKHPILAHWQSELVTPESTDDDDDFFVEHVTCMVCYERLIQDRETLQRMPRPLAVGQRNKGRDNSHLKRDLAAPQCSHAAKKIITKDEKYKHGDYTDALCEECGVVLRHPEGPGGWEEVIFNGYIVREEP